LRRHKSIPLALISLIGCGAALQGAVSGALKK